MFRRGFSLYIDTVMSRVSELCTLVCHFIIKIVFALNFHSHLLLQILVPMDLIRLVVLPIQMFDKLEMDAYSYPAIQLNKDGISNSN